MFGILIILRNYCKEASRHTKAIYQIRIIGAQVVSLRFIRSVLTVK